MPSSAKLEAKGIGASPVAAAPVAMPTAIGAFRGPRALTGIVEPGGTLFPGTLFCAKHHGIPYFRLQERRPADARARGHP